MAQTVTSLSPSRPGFNPRPFQVEFAVEEVALGHVFLEVFWCSPVTIIHQCCVINCKKCKVSPAIYWHSKIYRSVSVATLPYFVPGRIYNACIPSSASYYGVALIRIMMITPINVPFLCMIFTNIPYILESNLHPFYSFRALKNQMRIRFAVESWILEK